MIRLKLDSIISLLLLSLLLTISANAQNSNEKPNVLFISIDDLNDWIGVMNTHPQVQTPNINRLAEQGTLFTNIQCSRHRLLEEIDGKWYWEGELIEMEKLIR
jgi:hypothetical protein